MINIKIKDKILRSAGRTCAHRHGYATNPNSIPGITC